VGQKGPEKGVPYYTAAQPGGQITADSPYNTVKNGVNKVQKTQKCSVLKVKML
jgi:hypothetical protein